MWLFVGIGPVMADLCAAGRGHAVIPGDGSDLEDRADRRRFSARPYWIAIWAMTVAPIALVAALRETSVLFGAAIAVVFLKEPFAQAASARR